MLNLVLVKSFLTLTQTGSFQQAAQRLLISQPTVSQHIKKLEEQLGVELIVRGRSGCEPTLAARAFLPYAQSLLRLNDRALAATRSGGLRIGAASNLGIYLLQPYLRSFLDRQGPQDLDLVIDRNPVIAEQLETGELDMAVMEWWDGRPGFDATRWRSEELVLITPPAHPWAGRDCIGRDELRGAMLLGGESGSGTGRLLAAYFGAGPLPRVERQLGSTEAVKQAVKAGLGISLVLAAAVAQEVAAGSLAAVPVEGSLCKDLFVIWRRRPQGSRPDFVSHLLQAA